MSGWTYSVKEVEVLHFKSKRKASNTEIAEAIKVLTEAVLENAKINAELKMSVFNI